MEKAVEKQKDVVIIGAGLTGLSLAHWLRKGGMDVAVIERSGRAGGVIRTIHEGGFIYESGPNTGVLSTPALAELFKELSPSCKLEKANSMAKKRLILKNGRWHALPSGPLSAVTTPLFSLHDKIRILGEPFRKKGSDPSETVADLVLRRMGRSFLDYAVDPFISGIYAGDPHQLVTRHALPKLYRLEQKYGSFIGGAIKKSREPKTDAEKSATREVFSVEGGLSSLISALITSVGIEHILTGKDIKVFPDKDGFLVQDLNPEDSFPISAKTIVNTCPAPELQDLFPFLNVEILKPVTGLQYAKVVQAVLGYKEWNGMNINAFGGLVPRKENRPVLGILFPSSMFDKRAPQGGALLSVFLGGIRNPKVIEESDEAITNIVLNEVTRTLQTNRKPDLLRIFRYQYAIPQYDHSSDKRLQVIQEIEAGWPGLILAGNIRDGIGMADRVNQAWEIAQMLLKKA